VSRQGVATTLGRVSTETQPPYYATDSPRISFFREAFESGRLDWTKAREITKVATPHTEAEWLTKAQSCSANELRQARKGEPAKRHRGHSFLLEDVALYDQLVAGIKKELGLVSDAQAVLELMRRGASGEPSQAPVARVVITECGTCREASSHTQEGPVPVAQSTVERARCSGEVHDLREDDNVVKRAIPAKTRRRILDRDGRRCSVPGCRALSALEIHHEDGWTQGHDPARMLTVCWWHHAQRHEGLLKIEGTAPDFRFLLADGTALATTPPEALDFSCEKSQAYLVAPSAPMSEAQSAERDAYLVLLRMEMGKREAKKRVRAALDCEPSRTWTAGDLVRAALLKAG
jgi:hypothetical protein